MLEPSQQRSNVGRVDVGCVARIVGIRRRGGAAVAAIAIAIAGLGACQSDDDDAGAVEDLDCDIEAVFVGTYRVTFVETSGDCGALDPGTFVRPSPFADNCVLESVSVSADRCAEYRQGVCDYEDQYGPFAIRDILVVTQQDEDGELLTGTADTTVFDADGVLCHSIYDLRVERL